MIASAKCENKIKKKKQKLIDRMHERCENIKVCDNVKSGVWFLFNSLIINCMNYSIIACKIYSENTLNTDEKKKNRMNKQTLHTSWIFLS